MKEILRKKIEALKKSTLSESDFLSFLQNFPFSNERHIKLDFHRKLRRGIPEVVFGQSKSAEQLSRIIRKFTEVGEDLLVTRVDVERFALLKREFPGLRYHPAARIITSDGRPRATNKGRVLVLSAGAADESIAEEAYVSSLYLGNRTDKEYDVGIACLARVLGLREKLNRCTVIIAVAGMEGALPSVVAGLTSTPVIAVPTSVGYGASFGGVSALLSMLNSCAGGISVVNIDNGFGAAYQATLISRKLS
jgi:NCAIR mutase (PurE)-related protein